MSWFLVTMFLSLTFGSFLSEAGHDKKLPYATVVVGTVYCDTCFQRDFSMGSHFISGASVAVECKNKNSRPKFRKEVKTNEQGEFRVQLPFSVSKHVTSIKGCTVKLIKSSESHCAVASTPTSSSLLLKSRNQGLHIFSVGSFSFKPLKKPNLCNQKARVQKNPRGLIESFPTKTSNKAQSSDHNVGGPEKFFFPHKPLFPTYPNVPNPIQSPPVVPSPMQPSSPTTPMFPNPWQPPNPTTPMVPSPMQPSSPTTPMVPSPMQPSSPMTPVFPNPWQKPGPTMPMVPNPMQPPSPTMPMVPNPMQPSNPTMPMPMVPNPFQSPPSEPSSWFKFKPPASSTKNASP